MKRFHLTITDEETKEQHLLIDMPLDFVPDTSALNSSVMSFLAREQARLADGKGVTQRRKGSEGGIL